MGGSLLDRDAIDMHSFCLMNRMQKMSNEEILFDYHLPFLPKEIPEWYIQEEYKSSGTYEEYS